MPQSNKQAGSILIYILVGIVLLGMLYFTFSRSGSTSSSIGNIGRTNVIALKILDDSNTVAQRTEKLLAKGCAPSQLQYDDFSINPVSPVDKSCNIFPDVSGGTFIMPTPPSGYDTGNPHWWGKRYSFVGKVSLPNQGTSCDEFFMLLWDINSNVCLALNKNLGIDSIPDVVGAWHNSGFISPSSACEVWASWAGHSSAPLQKATHVCFKYGDRNVYIRMLLAR